MIQQMKVNLSLSLGCSNCSAVPEPLLSSHVSSSVYSSCIKIRTASVYCTLPVGLFLEFLFREFLNILSFQPHGNPQRQMLLSGPFDRWENRGTAVLLMSSSEVWRLQEVCLRSPCPLLCMWWGRWVMAPGHDLGNWRNGTWFQCQPCGNQLWTFSAACHLSQPLCESWKWGWCWYLLSYGGEKN